MNQEKVSAEIWSMIRETQKNLSQVEQDRKKAQEDRNRAEKEGLFIIKATGDSASLVNQKNFKPKTFC